MGKYFGTDGFRGEANMELTADHAYKVGRFLGWYYNEKRRRAVEEGLAAQEGPARIVIGKDTRPGRFRRGCLPAARHHHAQRGLHRPRRRL